VAAAAKGNVPLLVIGLVISIPLIIFGSTLILKLMNRFPIIITAGAALLGWVAGEMVLTDPAIHDFIEAHHWLHNVVPALGAVLVVAIGKYLASRSGSDDEAAAAEEKAA
jgi:predicted tellurium resistance membrane protein TerC